MPTYALRAFLERSPLIYRHWSECFQESLGAFPIRSQHTFCTGTICPRMFNPRMILPRTLFIGVFTSPYVSSLKCGDTHRDETYGDVKTIGNNIRWCIARGWNIQGRNVREGIVPVPFMFIKIKDRGNNIFFYHPGVPPYFFCPIKVKLKLCDIAFNCLSHKLLAENLLKKFCLRVQNVAWLEPTQMLFSVRAAHSDNPPFQI